MRFAATVKAIMKQNLIAFWASGDPDGIYRFLTAELLESEPSDLLFFHDLLKREIANKTAPTTSGLSALTKRFFSDLRDVLCGILAERIGEYKEDKDFISLGQILDQALPLDPKILHEVGQLVYHDYYGSDVIERAQKSSMYKYLDEIDEHFRIKRERKEKTEGNGETDQIYEDSDMPHPVTAELRMIRLIDVISCFIDANPTNV